ncbi:solute carrier family 22 member 18 [Antennarius striatus]|uniref:solute carrier family 22 member 18 n=1 Tax=Antennarius striatus TaxID=241820 RepID=UPI0035B0C078
MVPGEAEPTEEASGAPGSSRRNPADDRRKTRVIFIVYLLAALDVSWMFLQFSVTPYLAKKMGFDTLWFGYLQTLVGMFQLLGGPLFGRFADLFGARVALSVSCSATVAFFLLLAASRVPAMLFLHKVPTLLMHVFPSCQMVVADLSEPEKRADALAKLGLCFGVGMIAGSTLGGHLTTRYGEAFTACVGAAGSAFSLLLVLMFVPENTKDGTAAPDAGTNQKSVFSLGEITRLMTFPGVARTFIVKTVAGFPSGIFQVMFSIIALEFFQLLPEQNGYLMAYFGVVQMVVQGGVIGRLTTRFSEEKLLLLSIGVSAVVGLAQALMLTVFHFCLIVVPLMFSLSTFNVITNSMLTNSVPPSDTGTMLGLCASVQSLTRTLGPTAGGFLYLNYGVSSIGLIQFVVNAVVFVYLLQRFVTNKEKRS